MGKKVGIFTGYFLPHMGGVQRYVDKLSSELKVLGYDIVIVTSNDEDLEDVDASDKYKIYRLPIHDLFKQRYPIPKTNKKYKKLISLIESENIDFFIVNTRFHLTSMVGARMAKRQGKPVVLIEHGTDHFTVDNIVLDYFGEMYEHCLTSTIRPYIDEYYGVSKKCNEWLEHFDIKAAGVFYNAIDANDIGIADDRYFADFNQDDIVITYAGRLIKEKGILNLISAFAQLSDGYENVKLAIAGDGDLLDEITTKYKSENIKVFGKLDFQSVMSLYKRSDIFVYPSLYPEGLPTSILEAGLMECAVVATPRGGTEEVINSGSLGIIVDGSINELKMAIERMILDKKHRKIVSRNIKKRVTEEFSWTTVAKEVDGVIKRISK